MSAWWDEQLAGGGARPQVPTVRTPHYPAPASPRPTHDSHSVLPVRDEWTWWWEYARASARCFLAGVEPPGIEVYGPILEPDEAALLSADVEYARMHGGDGRWRKSDLLVFGRPAVMAAGFAVNAVINHRRKVAARREAEVRWRDQQWVQVIATSCRLLCDTDQGWESYWYESATEFYPDLDGWSLTLGFGDQCAPLRLAGAAAPALCLWTATAVLAERWANDPRLARLLA